jgi:glycosyltransferase involved in cell wall biosynthesis
MSIYLIAQERGLTQRHAISGRLIYKAERLAFRLPDLLVLDTEEYVTWLSQTYDLTPEHFRLVPTGADDRIFHPLKSTEKKDSLFRALYYGSFTPNHGVEYILEAARILREEQDIYFELIGDGPTKAQALVWVKEWGLSNVVFEDWMDRELLIQRISEADICLGAFGTTPQSMMTIQNKIYEGLAMARPVLTGDSPTVRAALEHGKHLWLCERANAESLAQSILTLKENPILCASMATQGHQVFLKRYTCDALGERFAQHLCRLAGKT